MGDHDNHQKPGASAPNHQSNIDTSRPFRSVKEAVALFGERFLVGEIYSQKPFAISMREIPCSSPSLRSEREPTLISPRGSTLTPSLGGGSSHVSRNTSSLSDTVKKLESELELLKERESETEATLASLQAELHENIVKLALAKAANVTTVIEGKDISEEKKNSFLRVESGPSQRLDHILSIGEKDFGVIVGRKKERKMVRKKKPIVPLVGDLFWRKKGKTTALHSSLYASSHLQWN